MMTRNKEIDCLRAYAVLFVVILHTCLIICPASSQYLLANPTFNFGAGVDIFFAISGYVVCDAFHRLQAVTPSDNLYVTFILKRLRRLWPATACWLLICLVLNLAFESTGYWPPIYQACGRFLAGLIYAYNFNEYNQQSVLGYFWSLSIEFQFALILPFLMAMQRNQRLIVIYLLLVSCAFYRPGSDGWWMFRFDALLIGILVFEYKGFTIPKCLRLHKNVGTLLTPMFLILILSIGKCIPIVYLAQVVVSGLCGILVAFASKQKNMISNFSCDAFLTWVGLRSYSVYLCHIPVILTVLSVFKDYHLNPVWWPITSALSFVLIGFVSDISYRYLEPLGQKDFFSRNKWPLSRHDTRGNKP